MKKIVSVVLCASLLAGCGASIPVRTANSGNLPTNDLKLALVLTDKTHDSVKQFHALANTISLRQAGGVGASAVTNMPFDSVNEVFRKDFSSVVLVDSVEQAKTAGADLIAVLDYAASGRDMNMPAYVMTCILTIDLGIPLMRWINPRLVDLSADVTFMTPDQKQLDQFHAEAHRRAGVGAQLPTMISESSQIVSITIENALAASQSIAEYARQVSKHREEPAAAPVASAPVQAKPKGPSSDVDSPTYISEERADDLAVVIGIEKYSSIPDAQFAERDAEAMKSHLIALGYPERNIIYLAGEKATRSSIQKYVEVWLQKNAKPDSEVFFYFSGHGAPDPASKQAYLVPWDGDPKFLENTGYPIAKLYKSLGTLKAKRVLVALDSCFSGAGGRSVIAQGTRPLVMHIETSAPTSGGKLSVISASAGDQITGADEAQGHGLFTYYLLRALNRTGGKATVKDVYVSLTPEVEDAARRQNREQTPQLAGDAASLYFR